MPKRSSISAERLIQLTQKNARYIISCNQQKAAFCKEHIEGKCGRGFFSLFLQVVYGIAFAKKYGLLHYVDFSNVNYAYSGQQNDQKRGNFWEHFFDQIAINSTDTLLLNQQYEVYPLRIWNRKHHRFLHQIMKEGLKFKPSLKARD